MCLLLLPSILAHRTQACHLIFNRFEPQDLTSLITLLLLVPSGLSTLFHPHSSILIYILLAFTTYLGTLLCSIVLYRLSPFHPLAEYPGPVLCKISKLYSAWISLGGKQHFHYRRLHEKYGDVVRVGAAGLTHLEGASILHAPLQDPTSLPSSPRTRSSHCSVPRAYPREHVSPSLLLSTLDPIRRA